MRIVSSLLAISTVYALFLSFTLSLYFGNSYFKSTYDPSLTIPISRSVRASSSPDENMSELETLLSNEMRQKTAQENHIGSYQVGSIHTTRINDSVGVDTTSKKTHKSKGKGFVMVAAIGDMVQAQVSEYNIRYHYPGWDCVAFVYVDMETLGDDELMNLSSVCEIQRIIGLSWGIWVKSIPASLLRKQYNYVSVLLSDVFIDEKTDMNGLVDIMDKHNASTIQPGIAGTQYASTKWYPERSDLWDEGWDPVDFLEIFAIIYTADAWECLWNYLLGEANNGWCLDVCFKKHCAYLGPQIRSNKMGVYHLQMEVPPIITQHIMDQGLEDILREPMNKAESANDDNVNMLLCEREQCEEDGAGDWISIG